MRYKTSCFNPTVSRNCLRRFWPLPLAVLAMVLLALLMPLLGVLQDSSVVYRLERLLSCIYGTAGLMAVLMAGAAFLSAALSFHHLHSRKEIQFYLGLPLKRRCVYLTSYLTGLLMIAVPLLLGLVLCIPPVAAAGFGPAVPALLKLFGAGISVLLLFYSMAVVACTMAGQTFGALLIYAGMHCAAAVITGGAQEIASMFMPGLEFDGLINRISLWLTPLCRIEQAVAVRYSSQLTESVTTDSFKSAIMVGRDMPLGFSGPVVLAVYGAVGAALAVLAGVLYQKRPSETAGEMISYRWIGSLCKVFGALVVSAGGTWLTVTSGLFQEEIPFFAVVIAVLGFCAVGWLAAEMIVQKTLRVFRRKTAVPCGILLAVLLILMGVGKLDIFGTVRYLPAAADVKSAAVQYGCGYEVNMTPEDALTIHQAVLEHPEAITNNQYNVDYDQLYISYTLQNGRQISRAYAVRIHYDEDYNRLPGPITDPILAVMKNPDYTHQSWFGRLVNGVTRDNFYHATVQSYANPDETGVYADTVATTRADWRGYLDLTAQEAVALYEAICRDMEAGTVPPNGLWYTSGEESLGCVDFGCYLADYGPQYGTYSQYTEAVSTTYVFVELLPEMENTLQYLQSLGLNFQPA